MKKRFGIFRRTVGIKEAGIGIVARNTYSSDKVDGAEQDISLQEKYNNAYNNFPIVTASIDITAEQTVQHFYFEGPDEKQLTKFADKHNLGVNFYSLCKHLLRNGNCWDEYVKGNGDIDEIKRIDPTTMTTWRKKNGDVIGQSQSIDGKKTALWGTTGDSSRDTGFAKKRKLDNIVHYKFNVFGGDKYGNSIIHPCLPLLSIKDQIEADTKIIVRRYAAPIIHAKVGSDTMPPSDDDIELVKKGLKDIYSDTEYVTNYLTSFDVLGFEGKGVNVGEILDHVDKQIIAGLQTPSVLMGMAEKSNKASAEVQLRSYGRHIKSIQRQMKTQFEDEVIVKQLGLSDENKLIWGHAEEREQELEIDQLRGLVTDGIITPQKANDLLPSKFHEKLPPELENPVKQAAASQNQDQKPFQKGGDKIKDNPTDPTLKQKEPGQRRVKTDTKVPVK